MKHLFLVLLVLTGSTVAHSQLFDSAIHYRYTSPTFDEAADTLIAHAMTDSTDTTEGGPINSLIRWKYFMGGRVCNNVPVGADMLVPYGQALGSYMSALSTYCTTSTYGGSWNCVGPFINSWGIHGDLYNPAVEHQGRINAIWTGPNREDTSMILAGADAGGLWKTNDGGRHWRNITDGASLPGTIGVNCIAVNPLDTNIIYLAVGMSNCQYGRSAAKADGTGYQLGLVYSTDGGATWAQDAGFNSVVGATVVAAEYGGGLLHRGYRCDRQADF